MIPEVILPRYVQRHTYMMHFTAPLQSFQAFNIFESFDPIFDTIMYIAVH